MVGGGGDVAPVLATAKTGGFVVGVATRVAVRG